MKNQKLRTTTISELKPVMLAKDQLSIDRFGDMRLLPFNFWLSEYPNE